MKKLIILSLLLSGCGYSTINSQLSGQVKGVESRTPLICDDFKMVYISLGIMRNGTGSMSPHDIQMEIMNSDQEKLLREASESGTLVKITYDEKRIAVCRPEMKIKTIELIKGDNK